MATAAIPELREEEAPPGVRAIYAEIRQGTGIQQVNLIFRHLGLDEAVLRWAWGTIAPLYNDGRVAVAASRLQADLPVRHPPLWEAVPDAEATAVRAVLATYDRGNSMNLIGLKALLRVAAGGALPPDSHKTAPIAPVPELSALPAVPPLPRPGEIPPDLLKLVEDLAAQQGTATFGVLPSLYLHLTPWPDCIRRTHAIVRPLLGTPEWTSALDRLLVDADALAAELAGTVDAAAPRPAEGVLASYLETVEHFVGTAIPQMVLLGRVLAGGTAPGLSPA